MSMQTSKTASKIGARLSANAKASAIIAVCFYSMLAGIVIAPTKPVMQNQSNEAALVADLAVAVARYDPLH